jgi:hypothetical protein
MGSIYVHVLVNTFNIINFLMICILYDALWGWRDGAREKIRTKEEGCGR